MRAFLRALLISLPCVALAGHMMAYGAKANITSGLVAGTFDVFPISTTPFKPMFAGTVESSSPTDYWLYDHVWAQSGICLGANAKFEGVFPCDEPLVQTGSGWVHFMADDYTWSSTDTDYFYFAWCDRSETSGTPPNTRPDPNIRLAKIRQ